MRKDIKKLSNYIDQLNKEKKPKEHGSKSKMNEYDKMLKTVRVIRSVKEPEYPENEFVKRLTESLKKKPTKEKRKAPLFRKYIWITGMTAVAAAVVLYTSLNVTLPISNRPNIVSAMEKAVQGLQAYHGILEVVETNELGENMTQSKREIWADKDGTYYIKELEGFSKGQITVNNGKQKWQIRPEEDRVYIFEAFPDPYLFSFELGKEVEEARKALKVKTIGEEMIAGRNADILEITPDGGEPYQLWVDQETDLPLQRVSAMQNALQYKVTYSEVEFMKTIPVELFAYSLPNGYEEINTDPEQYVNTIEEAEKIVGFTPVIPHNIPDSYELNGISVKMNSMAVKYYYITADNKQTVLLQAKAEHEFNPDSNAILGLVNNNTAEIRTSNGAFSIRWQENGQEYLVLGNTTVDELSHFAKEMSQGKVQIPMKEELDKQPQIEVPVDYTIVENEQKSVDAGHSPWKLDPAFVTQVFASLLITPEGIVGDYPIAYEDIIIIENTGTEAIAEINGDITLARYVYLKRLIRLDETGIWTVVGYDPVIQK